MSIRLRRASLAPLLGLSATLGVLAATPPALAQEAKKDEPKKDEPKKDGTPKPPGLPIAPPRQLTGEPPPAPAPTPAAGDATPEGPMPVNPYAGTKAGDWTTILLRVRTRGAGVQEDRNVLLTSTVKSVEGDRVTIVEREKSPEDEFESRTRTYDVKRAPTLDAFIDLIPTDLKLTEVTTADEKKTVGGTEFATKRLTFATGEKQVAGTLWISPAVKLYGVLLRLEARSEDTTVSVEYEVVGHGNGDKVTWGKKAADVKLAEVPRSTAPEPKGEAPPR